MKINVVDISEATPIPVTNWTEYDLAITYFHNFDLLAPAEVEDDPDDGRFDYPEPNEVDYV